MAQGLSSLVRRKLVLLMSAIILVSQTNKTRLVLSLLANPPAHMSGIYFGFYLLVQEEDDASCPGRFTPKMGGLSPRMRGNTPKIPISGGASQLTAISLIKPSG